MTTKKELIAKADVARKKAIIAREKANKAWLKADAAREKANKALNQAIAMPDEGEEMP